ncbi:unnamed protein product [Rotaria sp. Silwood2]|nr:unnamed protein product [Rotaria sp. Silwood2]CAF3936569.1 unnamed protein product [Rotaria sp. Silwood2]CAF4098467.1 unnamed protein product [Rotaria sp. Silwood2]
MAAVGGYMQGRSHSPLSCWPDTLTDQVLEYDVVIADSRRLTVTLCEYGDLFCALDGGGPGTYAVVISVVLRTFPTQYIVAGPLKIEAPNDTRYAQWIRGFTRWLPSLADSGWSGYFSMVDGRLSISLLCHNENLMVADTSISQFINRV